MTTSQRRELLLLIGTAERLNLGVRLMHSPRDGQPRIEIVLLIDDWTYLYNDKRYVAGIYDTKLTQEGREYLATQEED